MDSLLVELTNLILGEIDNTSVAPCMYVCRTWFWLLQKRANVIPKYTYCAKGNANLLQWGLEPGGGPLG